MPRLPRRTVLLGALGGALSGALPGVVPRAPALPDPFTLGVASGDPAPDGVVLWTRLAPRPDAEDGRGGMPDRAVDVEWELAEDEGFTRVVRRGTETATAQEAHTVHAEPGGLAPGREYFYRFRTGTHLSPAARTRTAPAPDAAVPALTVATASCAKFGAGYFTAYRALAADEPDLVLHLGDYFYEADDGDVRETGGPEPTDLAGYRRTHAHQKSDPDLLAAHAVAPWVVVWDDHEVVNNWAGGDGSVSPDRRAAAFRAYWEHMPLRRASVPRGPDLQLYRRIGWGSLATFHMLDTRQYRMKGGSITGAEQERWLLDGFRASTAGWDVLGQQVFFAPRSGGGKRQTWDEHPESRGRIQQGWVDAGVRNAVVLTGDEHVHHANELPADPDEPDGPVVGTELVTTSVTSGGDGSDGGDDGDGGGEDDGDGGDDPHLRFRVDRRGYVLARFEPQQLRADFRTVERVSERDAPVGTAASFVVPDREPGLHAL
ncbi:alkaline phosphatase [Pseudonocardia sp. EC080610-09]|uniref:alkaline phosphatase D family protein n=1 Tax=unclassified Pseudonocardia TaxID=2619320 RepID=UPI0006CB6B46|nr:alkaline phosphatase [Pseudonocardia sp. EC080625-04]ALL76420.1 alkaline phosphatase [Pseudonocardia sp. EC080610-09]ALL83447.1 alkaline phosphatase [Pseudonocardia sp. EC080619-01]